VSELLDQVVIKIKVVCTSNFFVKERGLINHSASGTKIAQDFYKNQNLSKRSYAGIM
jgi:hypothetical protein